MDLKMNDEEINKRFEEIEKRLEILEGKNVEQNEDIIKNKEENFSGLAGGIRLLIKEDFLKTPKLVLEVFNKLKEKGYHYPKKSVEKLLSIDFTNKQRVLNRTKEDKKWKYVIRK